MNTGDHPKKLPKPQIRLRGSKLKCLEEVLYLKNPSYRQVMDTLLDHIRENNLQDENNRVQIIVDPIISKVFEIQCASISLNDLYSIVKTFIAPNL